MRTEAPQRWSTRFVYEAKWSVFVRWCKANQVDFHSPSVEQIADFLLHLFQDRKLQHNLCPVRVLHYCLDKTHYLRSNKELGFVSFKKNFNKDISPSTISSWIKQTMILCNQLSDQESLALHQDKAHEVRAIAASKAFQGGVSLEQILSACHWKSHNTFTQFYLKDVSWVDSQLYHLGQQVHS